MLSFYLDDAGTGPDSEHLTIAGYVADDQHWNKFEQASNRLFKNEKLKDAFHAKDFFDHDGQFSEWDPLRRVGFSFEWFNIAVEHMPSARGITMSASHAKYKEVKRQTGLGASVSLYCHCFKSILDYMLQKSALSGSIDKEGMSIFIESGNKNNTEIHQWFNKWRQNSVVERLFKPLIFLGKTDCRAIQLADYLAFFSKRFSNEFTSKQRKEMNEFLKTAKDKIPTTGLLVDEFGPNSNSFWL
jgi:hypothetical protein